MDWSIVVTIAGFLLGGGGLAALWRTRGQNRNDERSQLTAEQQAFRQSMASELSSLRQQILEVEKRNDLLESESREQAKQIASLTTQNGFQQTQLSQQATQIASLTTQNATQAAQIAALTEEKAAVIQRLQVISAQKEFIERENNDLRKELWRLRGKLPNRVELGESEEQKDE